VTNNTADILQCCRLLHVVLATNVVKEHQFAVMSSRVALRYVTAYHQTIGHRQGRLQLATHDGLGPLQGCAEKVRC